MRLTPEQVFFNSAPIDPKAPHPYFLNRGIDTTRFSDLDQVVRIEPRYRREPTHAWSPAVIAAVTDNDGRIVGRQYKPLTADLSAKDGIEPKTKNGAGDKLKGYAIRLGPAWATLYLAEGLEDAMTVMRAFDISVTAFAVGGAGMMDGFIPPKGTREIVILSDRDEKGIQSAAKAVEWFGALGLTVRVARPPEDFKDFNAAVTGTLDAALDKAQAAVRAAVEAAEVCFVSPFSEEWGAQIQTFNDCMTAAGALESGDHARVMALLARAAAIGLSSLQADMLVKAVQKTTDIGIKNLRKTLANETEEARLKAWKAGAAERERAAVAQEAARRRKIEEERARLWDSCLRIAMSKKLLEDAESVSRELGLVGEGASVRQLYLTYASRMLIDDSVRLLRLGAPAAGKNLVVEKMLELVPTESVIRFSGASPKALAYYGGADPNAFKGKIIYIPEAVVFTDRHGVESEFTTMLRTLISEGRIVYSFVSVRDGQEPTTVTIVKNGPIAAIITTARDVDPELKTRTLVNDADETGSQTVAIVKRILSDVRLPRPDLQPWLDFQAWLMMDAPYRVRIPFKEAIFAGFERWRSQFLETAALRVRRDINNIICAVKASAVLHRAQRAVDEDGAILATLDDYANVHSAFDGDLANLYGKVSEKTVAVVRAIEHMGGAEDLSVKVTLRELAKRLGIVSLKTAGIRLIAAADHGAVEQDDSRTGPGGARFFKVVKTAKDIEAEPSQGMLPPVGEISRFISARTHPQETGEQREQGDRAQGERARI
jgi:Toprim domain